MTALKRSGVTLAELTSDLTLFPQKLINVRIEKGFNWQGHAAFQAECTQVEQELGSEGRILIRASGTEPLLRVMVEARQEELAERFAKRLAQTISA